MITVKFTLNGITVKGHAGSAPYGHDIICAAVSTLIQTLAASLDTLCDCRGLEFNMDPGDAYVSWKYVDDDAKMLIDAFFIGCSNIAEVYPEYVRITSDP